MSDSYDYIIAGGGCAGMSLAHHFLKNEYFQNKRILVIEKDLHLQQDKTWCYWSQASPSYKSASKVSWENFTLRNESEQLQRSISPYRYFHINSLDFHQEIRELIEESENVHYLHASIVNIEEKSSKVFVDTDQGSYDSAYVFSSLPDKIKLEPKKYHYLKQQFLGWEISCDQEVFDKETVHLMDFDHSGAGNSFFYILPFSSRKALVEFTIFSENLLSEEAYESQLKAYIEEKLGIANYEISYREKGVIPMHNHRLSPFRKGKRQILLGTAGGCSKASTGYTFSRIQEQTQAIVASLKQDGSPVYQLQKKSRFNFYDTLLLNIIKYRPEILPQIFLTLFKRNPAEKVLRFLDEKTSLWEEVSIFLRLPWLPFFGALKSELVQRVHYFLGEKRILTKIPFIHSNLYKRLQGYLQVGSN